MRQMRPLMLPKLVAARNCPNDSNDEKVFAQYPDSTHSAASECSTPLSATFSTHGHMRHSSSISSLSSSPPSSYEHLDSMASSGKLPQLEELEEAELSETEEFPMFSSEVLAACRDGQILSPCLCDLEVCAHQDSSKPASIDSPEGDPPSPAYLYDLSDSLFADDNDSTLRRLPKRRRSGVESPVSNISSRIGERFPSLSRRWKDRSRAGSVLSRENTRASTPSGGPSSRASSMTGSIKPPFSSINTSETELPVSPTRDSIVHEEQEFEEVMLPSSPVDIAPTAQDADPIDRAAFASTPLLPPVMDKRSPEETPLQSPLQSPSIADSTTFSAMNSPLGTPNVQTPPLSTKPSIASFGHSRPAQLVPCSDIPPMTITEEHDEWSIKLGHANFTIYPEPYMPDICDAAACRELFANWEQARCNFTKHQVRTGEHFGVTSKTYKLTEQKWAEVDAQWKCNHDAAVARATKLGLDKPADSTPSEPAPLMNMPSLNDAQDAGKFPNLGDEDIVGPMVQIAARIPHARATKKAGWTKFLGDLKFPGALLGRARAQ